MKLRRMAAKIVDKHLGEQVSGYTELVNAITDALRQVQKQSDYDDSDEFEEHTVFVIMPFTGSEMLEVYSAIKDGL